MWITVFFITVAFIGAIIYRNERDKKIYGTPAKKTTGPRRVTVDYLSDNQTDYKNSQAQEDEIFNKEQKLAVISCLEMISSLPSHMINLTKRAAQKEMISRTLINNFKLTEESWGQYKKNIEPNKLQTVMSALTQKQKRIFFAYVFELLGIAGIPTQQEIMVAENLCEKVANISNNDFEKLMSETAKMLDSLS